MAELVTNQSKGGKRDQTSSGMSSLARYITYDTYVLYLIGIGIIKRN